MLNDVVHSSFSRHHLFVFLCLKNAWRHASLRPQSIDFSRLSRPLVCDVPSTAVAQRWVYHPILPQREMRDHSPPATSLWIDLLPSSIFGLRLNSEDALGVELLLRGTFQELSGTPSIKTYQQPSRRARK